MGDENLPRQLRARSREYVACRTLNARKRSVIAKRHTQWPNVQPDLIFKPDLFAPLEESVRVDRESDAEQKRKLLEDYRLTRNARAVLQDFFERTGGIKNGEQRRAGHCTWLYGYYGSGKSHLLAVAGLLLDSEWVEQEGRDRVWHAFGGEGEDTLRRAWEGCLDAFFCHPLFVNLLKHQGRRKQGFGSILLQAAHEKEGLSSQLGVAFFEKWYRKRSSWEDRSARAEEALAEAGVELPERQDRGDAWALVQQYHALSELALPRLLEAEVGSAESLRDIMRRSHSPEHTAQQIEAWRKREEEEQGRPVKGILLLDEVSLFIGTEYNLLTELNALAERIDEVGGGRLACMVTAQESLTEERSDFAKRKLDFSILYDRFPHQHGLPSGHVGEIVAGRLLEKTEAGREHVEKLARDAKAYPPDALVYAGGQQNVSPALDEMSLSQFADFYPLLPYHPPLFLEILARLRTEESDRSKSIFSGTARAVLAIADALVKGWAEEENEERVVSLVDFFEIVRPELEEVVPQEIATIDKIEEEVEQKKLRPLDADICKVVLLLQYVPEMVPLDRLENIAVGVMGSLTEMTRAQATTAVSEALERLDRYVRESEAEGGAHLRFTTQEERRILRRAEEMEGEPWGKLMPVIEEQLWPTVVRELDLSAQVAYPSESDAYPVRYQFRLPDGTGESKQMTRAFGGDENSLVAKVCVAGLLSDEPVNVEENPDTLIWTVPEEEREHVRDQIRAWAALTRASQERLPEAIEQDLRRREQELPQTIAAFMQRGEQQVQFAKPTSTKEAVRKTLGHAYPSQFHPELLRVEAGALLQLRGVRSEEDLPRWAKKIGVPFDERSSLEGNVPTAVRGRAGRTLREHKQLSVDRLLEIIIEKEDSYSKAMRPALAALLWGFCRRGDFRPVNASGKPLETDVLLSEQRWGEVRLQIARTRSLREHLGKLPFIEAGEGIAEALRKLRVSAEEARRDVCALEETVRASRDNCASAGGKAVLDSFAVRLVEKRKAAESVLGRIDEASGDEWAQLIEELLGLEGWRSQAKERWERRRLYLTQLDAQLKLAEQAAEEGTESLPWLDVEAKEALFELGQDVEAAARVRWWTEGGWQDFTSSLPSRRRLGTHLREAWERFAGAKGTGHTSSENGSEGEEGPSRHALWSELSGQAWLRPAIDLPSNTSMVFQRKYLDPLRRFAKQFEQSRELVDILAADLTEVDSQALQKVSGQLQRGTDGGALRRDPSDVATAWHALRESVGDRLPDQIQFVGLWPEDEEVLRKSVRAQVKGRPATALRVEVQEKGVVVQHD